VIEAIVFDVGGVLCPNPLDEFTRLDAEYALPAGTIQSFVRGGSLFAQCETGRLPIADFYAGCAAAIARQHGVRVPTTRLEALFATVMGTSTTAEMLSLVAEVKAAGYQIGLLTNIFAERRPWLRSLFPPGTVDVYCDSSAVGLRKPDPAIYLKLLELLGRAAEEVVFVDDFPENLAPARAMGIVDVLFESPEQVRDALVHLGVQVGRRHWEETAQWKSA
jgi:epoxide hydrolase-like predicted phosphatase